jgi:glutamine amidotransferase
MKVTVVDLGVGNIPNVVRAFRRLGAEVTLTAFPEEVARGKVLVLPGVGAAPPAVRALEERGLAGALGEAVAQGGWVLGICLGHQLLFEELREFGQHRGLGLVPGVVAPMPTDRLPHMGWARVEAVQPGFSSLDGRWFYFVHSFAGTPRKEHLLATAEHQGHRFCAAVRRGRVVGVQFHPEKSGPAGAAFLREFLEMAA